MLGGIIYASYLIVFPVRRYDLVSRNLQMKTLGPMIMDYSAFIMTFTIKVRSMY